jgi:hypothetical protein
MAEATAASQKKADPKLVKTPKALGSYVTLVKPRAMEPGKPEEYSINLLWDKKSTDMTAIKAAILAAAVEKFGPNAGKLMGPGGKIAQPISDGDQKFAESEEKYSAYKGKWYINAKSRSRVSIVDSTRTIIDPSEVYSGCYFHASIRFFAYDWQKKRKGVGAGLQALMLVNRGPRLDGREDAASAFKDFEVDESAVEGEIDDIMGGAGGEDLPF